MDPILGQLMLFGGNFAPRGWAFCNGQLMSIAQNTALFALLGTTYGGDGVITFALPDLRGRVPLHFGQGPGLSNYVQGESAGAESATITVANLPAHTHTFNATSSDATDDAPSGRALANADSDLYATGAPNVTMNAAAVGSTGGSQPMSIRPPYLVLTWCIALQGIFPSRS